MKKKITIEIDMSSANQKAMICIIPSVDSVILEKYFFPITEADIMQDVFKLIEKKISERSKAEPEIYKHFGS